MLIAAVAVLLRLAVHFSSGRAVPPAPAPLAQFLTSPEHIWSSPPLPALTLSAAWSLSDPGAVLLALELLAVVAVVVLLVRLGERWLDYRVGLLGAAAWAFCSPAVAVFRDPGSEGWQAALSILCAAALLRVARRRAPREAWRIGASAGLLSLYSGGGLLWAVGAVAWLPFTSRRFRGRAWFAAAGLVLAGWTLVLLPVIVRNAVLSGGELVLPVSDTLGQWMQCGVDSGAAGWASMGQRTLALLGGGPGDAIAPAWTLPWAWLVLLAWTGVVALLPGARFLFPLLLGGIIALLRGALHGLDVATVLAAAPFVCLYAGYGSWRIATGWRAGVTWFVSPAVFVLALLLHFLARGGS